LSGALSLGIYAIVKKFVLGAAKPVEATLTFMPIAYGTTMFFLMVMILAHSTATKDVLEDAEVAGTALAFGLVVGLASRFLLVPKLRKRAGTISANATFSGGEGSSDNPAFENDLEGDNKLIGASSLGDSAAGDSGGLAMDGDSEITADIGGGGGVEAMDTAEDGFGKGYRPMNLSPAEGLFLYLQVFTAALKSFAHGANDTANAAGPLAALIGLWSESFADDDVAIDCIGSTPVWVMFLIAAGMVIGLWAWGERVMRTVGKDICDINFSKGFSIELGSALSVVLASAMMLPVSSTHCQIGSVVAVGLYESGRRGVDYGVLGRIGLSWAVTLPLSIALAAVFFYLMRPAVASAMPDLPDMWSPPPPSPSPFPPPFE